MFKLMLMVMIFYELMGDIGKKMGMWFEEFVLFYYVFKDVGYLIILVFFMGG